MKINDEIYKINSDQVNLFGNFFPSFTSVLVWKLYERSYGQNILFPYTIFVIMYSKQSSPDLALVMHVQFFSCITALSQKMK